jgi:kynurenine formamidase
MAASESGCFIRADGSNLINLSHDWHQGMTELPFFPPMRQEAFHTLQRDGIRSFSNHLSESCGTHCEAPGHVLADAPTIEQVPVTSLIGPAVVVDVEARCAANPDYKLSIDDLAAWERRHGRIPDGGWLIMRSGWHRRWNSDAFLNLDAQRRDHYPGFEPAAARWLVENQRHIVGIGTECFSPEGGSAARDASAPTTEDSAGSHGRRPRLPVRHELLPVWNTLVLANLAQVDRLPEAGAWLIVGVIAFRGGSGGQARVFGVLPA